MQVGNATPFSTLAVLKALVHCKNWLNWETPATHGRDSIIQHEPRSADGGNQLALLMLGTRLRLNQGIRELADVGDGLPCLQLLQHRLERELRDLGGLTVLVSDCRVAQVLDFLLLNISSSRHRAKCLRN